MTINADKPAYGRKRGEKCRRGTNGGKRCLSRGKPVEEPGAVKPIEKLLWSEPGEFFSPGPRSHFSAFGHQPGAFFWPSLFFCGKRKGERNLRYNRTHGPCVPTARTVSRGVNSGYSWIPHRVRDDLVTASKAA